jgi:hypothetical protein
VGFEAIEARLLQMPDLVNRMERGDAGFVPAVKEWLAGLEGVLKENGLAVVAEIATLRASLISAQRGTVPVDLVSVGRPSARKLKAAAAAHVLRQAELSVSEAIKPAAASFAEGERLARQLAVFGAAKGLFPSRADFSTRGGWLAALWQALRGDVELLPAATHLAALVGAYDALILLDRALPES